MVHTPKTRRKRSKDDTAGTKTTTSTGRGRIIETTGEIGAGRITAAPGEAVITRRSGRGFRVAAGDPTDPNLGRVTTREVQGGQQITRFGQAPPPAGVADNIQVLDPVEQARQAALTPQQRLSEQVDAQFDTGLQTGDFGNLTIDQVNERLIAGGLVQAPGEAVIEDEAGIEDVTKFGTAIPVATANLISKGLSILGIDIGTISNEQFSSTTIGKLLGGGVLVAGGALVGAVGGLAAGALFPAGFTSSTTLGSLTATSAARVTTGAAAAKTGLGASIASSKLIKALFVGGAAVSIINGRIGDLETSIVNQRETITLIGSGVQVGAISPTEAILMFNDIEEDLNDTESKIHQTAQISLKSWLGKGKEVETRVQKARQQLVTERGRLVQFVATPQL